MNYDFGIPYWSHPVNNNLEFIIAKKYSIDHPLSLFYHFHDGFDGKFYADILGLLDSFDQFQKILNNMYSPHQKTIASRHTVYYVNIPYNPQLIIALNGFQMYLDKCKKGNKIDSCKTYPLSFYLSYQVVDVVTMKSMISGTLFNDKSLQALSNFSIIIQTLEKNISITNMSFIPSEKEKDAALKIFSIFSKK